MHYFYLRATPAMGPLRDTRTKKGHPVACMAIEYLDGIRYQLSRCSIEDQFSYEKARKIAQVRLKNIPLRITLGDEYCLKTYWMDEVYKIVDPGEGHFLLDLISENRDRFSRMISVVLAEAGVEAPLSWVI